MFGVPAQFSIVTVCTGNLCRSPMAEQLLRARLADVSGVAVGSAGTIARAGDAMPPQAAALSRQYGGDPTAHAARRLTEQVLEGAGLVLAMAREHRREIVTLVPRVTRVTFTVREFARLAAALDDSDLAEVAALRDARSRLGRTVELVAANRAYVPIPDDPSDDDVVDPFQRDDATFQLSGRQLAPAVEAVAHVLRRAALGGR
ncbi:MAG: low molecular weight phosphatase family protein [Naasia sp.]|nr:low molecular weight phosphatase family protein [Naasia sp.]